MAEPRDLLNDALTLIRELNAKVPCAENLHAIQRAQEAVGWLDAREQVRTTQGVEGTPGQHDGPHLFICTDCGQVATIHLH